MHLFSRFNLYKISATYRGSNINFTGIETSIPTSIGFRDQL